MGILVRLVICVALMLMGCTALLNPARVTNPNLLLGSPSPATRFNAKDYLIDKPQYVLSYNRDRGIPNWASWQLNADWLGSLPRSPFTTDNSLPTGWYAVTPDDYTGSGFDRGHVVPAADRNKTLADSQAVFLMTNILPQAPDNNRGPWEKLESYCRDLVRQGRELYIIAGGVGIGGTGDNGKKLTIKQGQITVPAQTWKVVVILDRPGLGLAGVTEKTGAIAVIMPNIQGIKEDDWRKYQVSIDQVEELTGYDLLANVPPSIQSVIEAKRIEAKRIETRRMETKGNGTSNGQ